MSDTVNDLLLNYLETLQSRGEQRVPLDDFARKSLGKWLRAARAGHREEPLYKTPVSSSDSVPAPASVADNAEPQKEATLGDSSPKAKSPSEKTASAHKEDKMSLYEKTIASEGEHFEEDDAPATIIMEPLNPPQGSVMDILNYLRKKALHWPPVEALGTLRNTMVFSTGNIHAKIMLIGEAPGYQEERQREPFVGPAGEKLNQILKAMGVDRKEVYISNIVKFRPSMPNQTTNNRQPTEQEIEACLPFILAEIRTIRPQVIVALGGTAAQGLLGVKGTLGSLRGRFHEVEGIPVRVTYHPSYLLRTESNRDKRLVWEDMLTVMEQLGMPVSEKQRAYFKTN